MRGLGPPLGTTELLLPQADKTELVLVIDISCLFVALITLTIVHPKLIMGQ